MKDRPSTADEVLALYQVIYDTGEVCEPLRAFHEAYQQWQAARGPVTRDWFVERFGNEFATGEDVAGNDWAVTVPDADGYVLMETEDAYGAVTVKLNNPTCGDIEALVRLLNGKDGE